MLKKISKGLIVGTLGIGVFVTGAYTQAANEWLGNVISEHNMEIKNAADDKVDELRTRAEEGVKTIIMEKVDTMTDEKITRVENELEEYFNANMESLVDAQQIEEIDAQLSYTEEFVLENQKGKIDQILAEASQ